MELSIDLHGVRHADVQRLLDARIWEAIRKNIPSLTVVTGQSTEMKRLVSSVAEEYDLRVRESTFNPGTLHLEFL